MQPTLLQKGLRMRPTLNTRSFACWWRRGTILPLAITALALLGCHRDSKSDQDNNIIAALERFLAAQHHTHLSQAQKDLIVAACLSARNLRILHSTNITLRDAMNPEGHLSLLHQEDADYIRNRAACWREETRRAADASISSGDLNNLSMMFIADYGCFPGPADE